MPESKRWNFLSIDNLPPDQVVYWIKAFSHMLKFAVESEFNLVGIPGLCEGEPAGLHRTTGCACSLRKKLDCDSNCAIHDVCSETPNRSKCAKNKDGSCSIKDFPVCPTDCKTWELDCLNSNCSDFEPMCNKGCSLFSRGCNDCIQYKDHKEAPAQVRAKAKEALRPSESIADYGDFGVEKVIHDGSLLGNGGMEVCTVGNKFNFVSFLERFQRIVQYAADNKAYVNQRCSTHIHALISYFPGIDIKNEKFIKFRDHSEDNNAAAHKGYIAEKELTDLEQNIPSVILDNLVQLYRYYMPVIVWMTSTGTKRNNLTRWEKYRQNFINYCPVSAGTMNFLYSIRKNIKARQEKDNGKYCMVNFNHLVLDNIGDENGNPTIKRFHIEFRVMDGCMSPITLTTWVALHYALILKAVKLSALGKLELFTEDEPAGYYNPRNLLPKILNNNPPDWGGGNRDSNTSELTDDDIRILKEASKEFCKLLSKELQFMHPSLPDLANSLAETPISERRISGQKWTDIEESLQELIKRRNIEPSFFIKKAITINSVTAPDRTEWVKKLAKETDQSVNIVGEEINRMESSGKIAWDSHLNSYYLT